MLWHQTTNFGGEISENLERSRSTNFTHSNTIKKEHYFFLWFCCRRGLAKRFPRKPFSSSFSSYFLGPSKRASEYARLRSNGGKSAYLTIVAFYANFCQRRIFEFAFCITLSTLSDLHRTRGEIKIVVIFSFVKREKGKISSTRSRLKSIDKKQKSNLP